MGDGSTAGGIVAAGATVSSASTASNISGGTSGYVLKTDGSGNLSFTTAWSGTYSTGEGQIVTVTNGLITSVV